MDSNLNNNEVSSFDNNINASSISEVSANVAKKISGKTIIIIIAFITIIGGTVVALLINNKEPITNTNTTLIENNTNETNKTEEIKKVVSVTFNNLENEYPIVVNVFMNETVSRPEDPIKDGYKFVGWYLNDEIYDFNLPVEDNLTLIAKWEEIIQEDPVINTPEVPVAPIIEEPVNEVKEIKYCNVKVGAYLGGEEYGDFSTVCGEKINFNDFCPFVVNKMHELYPDLLIENENCSSWIWKAICDGYDYANAYECINSYDINSIINNDIKIGIAGSLFCTGEDKCYYNIYDY